MSPHPTAYISRFVRVARQEVVAVASLLVVAVGVLTFLRLADTVRVEGGQGYDWRLLKALRPYADDPGRPWGPWWLHEAAVDITSLGGISVLGLFGLIAIGLLLLLGRRLSALILVLGLAGSVMLSEGLKAVFDRVRPPDIYQAVDTLNASFPSGHALLATTFYLSLGVMLTRAFRHRHLKAYAMGSAILISLLIGVTRIYLGAHWASDVLGGWSVGAAFAMVLWLFAYVIERRQKLQVARLQDASSTKV